MTTTTTAQIPTQEELDVLPSHSMVIETIVLYYFREVLQDAIETVAEGRLTLKGALGGIYPAEGVRLMGDDALQLIFSLIKDTTVGGFQDSEHKAISMENAINAILVSAGPVPGLLTELGLGVIVRYNNAGHFVAKIKAVDA